MTYQVESVVFKSGVDDNMQIDSVHSVQSGSTSYAGSPAVLGASGATILNKIPGIPCFLGTEREKTLFSLNSGIMPFPRLEGILMSN